MAIKKLSDSEWIITIKDTPFNVVHNDKNVFVVYSSKADVIEAAKVISELRKVKYL